MARCDAVAAARGDAGGCVGGVGWVGGYFELADRVVEVRERGGGAVHGGTACYGNLRGSIFAIARTGCRGSRNGVGLGLWLA